MEKLISSSLILYIAFYVFEGPIRLLLNSIGADSFIFIRDVIIAIPLIIVLFQQFIFGKVDLAFYVYFYVIIVHGIIIILNIGSVFTVLYSAKMLMSVLVGAIFYKYLINPSPRMVMIVAFMWLITFITVMADKYFVEFPWTAMQTTIGDTAVEIGRDWQISGANKRAGGMMRSSIHVAIIAPLLALMLMFNLRSLSLKTIVAILTLATIYWTTQKASILSFVSTCGILMIFYKRPIPFIKVGITTALILMVLLPILLPHFDMPRGGGDVFSMSSFYMRIEDVWPKAWLWIERNSVFPFGVGLGGIGGAQRFYDVDSTNPTDNMFIIFYAFFGLFSIPYLAIAWWWCMRVPHIKSSMNTNALCVILFLFLYGCALTVIEDQMGGLFLGAALACIARAANSEKNLSEVS